MKGGMKLKLAGGVKYLKDRTRLLYLVWPNLPFYPKWIKRIQHHS
jgi:hypothetical protein